MSNPLTTICRENITVPYYAPGAQRTEPPTWLTGTLIYTPAMQQMELLLDDQRGVLRLTAPFSAHDADTLAPHQLRVLDAALPANLLAQLPAEFHPRLPGLIEALLVQGVITKSRQRGDSSRAARHAVPGRTTAIVTVLGDLGKKLAKTSTTKRSIMMRNQLTHQERTEKWRVPVNATHPRHMRYSPDYHAVPDQNTMLVVMPLTPAAERRASNVWKKSVFID